MVVEQEYDPLPFTVQAAGQPVMPVASGPATQRDVPTTMPWPQGQPVPMPGAMPVATPMAVDPTFTG
jgi:hypothetical protein